MVRGLLVVVYGLMLAGGPAFGWNEKGHMVVARLAWSRLQPDERAWVVDVLKRHPHYDEFLAANRPAAFSEDEWVFLRASTWADWIKSHHSDEYSRGEWHYINFPVAPDGSPIDPAEHPAPASNVVAQITASTVLVRGGNRVDRAVHLAWLFHLVGDVHQPLHTVALFSDRFPEGDRGGNSAFYRVEGQKIKLHSFWDGLLGNEVSSASLRAGALELETLLVDQPSVLAEATAATTPKEWAMEGVRLAGERVYVAGMEPAEGRTPLPQVPEVGVEYAKRAGAAARVAAAKAGCRLAEKIRSLRDDD
ncbi:MAG: S1/P1 nuclease [Planctomycetia bacterium]